MRKEFENRFQGFQQIFFFFWYICGFFFNWRKYITCEFSNGMYTVAVGHPTQRKIWSSLYQIFMSPVLILKNTSHFTTIPYSCHFLLAVHTSVNSYCQGWNIGRVTFQTPWELTRNCNFNWSRHWCISFTWPNTPLVLCFCCCFLCFNLKYIKENVVTYIC